MGFPANMSMSNMTEQPEFGIEMGAWLAHQYQPPPWAVLQRERQAGCLVRRITFEESRVHLARYGVRSMHIINANKG
jgi:hypothetical protein